MSHRYRLAGAGTKPSRRGFSQKDWSLASWKSRDEHGKVGIRELNN